jgi:hypothetical protein
MTYQFGLTIFKTKTEITKYFQSYHNSNEVGTILKGDHKAVMTDLIKKHPNYDKWNVQEDVEFKIDIGEYGEKKYLMKNGNEWQSFSYIKCIKSGSKENNIKSNVMRAARNAINDQIMEYRENNKENDLYKCSTCCKYFKNIDVDHDFKELTFKTMFNNFMSIKKKEYQSFKLIKNTNGSFFNSIDCNEWCNYHKNQAILRLLCRKCHQYKY